MFGWVFDPLPDPLQWAALFIGGLALLLALVGLLMRLLEALVNAPNITLGFNNEDFGEGLRYLTCDIFNLPVRNSLARRLFRRSAAAATVHFVIKDVHTNQVLVGVEGAAVRLEANRFAVRATISASEYPYSFPIVSAKTEDGAYVFSGSYDARPTYRLNPGKYEATVLVTYDGGEVTGSRSFQIGKEHYEAFWVND